MGVQFCFAVFAMSVLSEIWEPQLEEPAETAPGSTRGWKNKVQLDEERAARSRSPRRRRCGVKAMLLSWAKGDSSAVSVWRLAHAIVTDDGTDAGIGMRRLAELATMRTGSEKNCTRKLRYLLADTALPSMVREVPHTKGEDTITHLIRPTELIRLIHSHNRRKLGQIFNADKAALKQFWTSLFASEDGREFKHLHPTLRDKSPEQLCTSIPIVVHEYAAPYRKTAVRSCVTVGAGGR